MRWIVTGILCLSLAAWGQPNTELAGWRAGKEVKGMKVLRHDSGEHMIRGVLPTHPVVPTLEGIRAGRDEVLERGVELLK